MSALLRLAARDARRKLGRTLIAVLLIAVPMAFALPVIALTGIADTSREDALAALPDGVAAEITATAASPSTGPITQTPEGVTSQIIADPDTLPASDAQLREILGKDADLREWWRSPELIATTGLTTRPGEESAVSAVETAGQLDAEQMDTLVIAEADPALIGGLAPDLLEGALPASDQEIVLSRAAADRLGVTVGGTIQLIAPPATGWMNSDGRIGEIVQDSARGYRVSGIVADQRGAQGGSAVTGGWAGAGWLEGMLRADGAGASRHLLVMDGTPVSWEQVRALNDLRAVAVSRQVLEDYPARDQLYPPPSVDPQERVLQATLVAMSALGSGVLLLLLTAPAYLIGADRQRRETGLLAACGAAPSTIRMLLLLQGGGLGLLASALGIGAGLAVAALLRAQQADGVLGTIAARIGAVPIWALVLGLVLGTMLGLLSTAPAAWRSGRLDPAQALAPHRTPGSGGTAVPPPWIGAAASGGAALLCGIGSIALSGGIGAALLVFAALGAVIAMIALAPSLVRAAARASAILPVDARLVLRDMARGGSGSLPVITAVMASTLVMTILVLVGGSFQANQQDVGTRMTAAGGATLGTRIPLDDELDEAVLGSVTAHLEEQGLIAGSHPVLSTRSPHDIIPVAMPGPQVSCGGRQAVSVASAITPGAAVECVPEDDGWHPGLSMPSWLSDSLVVMDPAAMRATGFPDAEEAAQVLEEGGVIVNDATRLDARGSEDPSRGTVHIQLERWSDARTEVLGGQSRPGMFLHGSEGYLTMTPQTAAELGIPLRYVGEILETSAPLDAAGARQLEDAVQEISTLGWVSAVPRNSVAEGLGRAPVALLVLLVLVTSFGAAASLVLGRQEALADRMVLRSIGASPVRLQAQGVIRTIATLAIGVVPGLVAGGGIGVLAVLWLRQAQVGGPWRAIAPMWSLLGIWLGSVCLAVGLAALLASLLEARVRTRAGGPGRRAG